MKLIKYLTIILFIIPIICVGQDTLTESDFLISTEKLVIIPEINDKIYYQEPEKFKSIYILTNENFRDFNKYDSIMSGNNKLYFYNQHCLKDKKKYFLPIKIEKYIDLIRSSKNNFKYIIYYEFKLISGNNYPFTIENKKNKSFIGFATLHQENEGWEIDELQISKLNYKKIEIEK